MKPCPPHSKASGVSHVRERMLCATVPVGERMAHVAPSVKWKNRLCRAEGTFRERFSLHLQ